jgi:hypothetical protein
LAGDLLAFQRVTVSVEFYEPTSWAAPAQVVQWDSNHYMGSSKESQGKQMNKAESIAKLAKVKLELAAKCDRLAKTSKSTPKRNTMIYHAARFRRQAADLSRQ